MLKSGLAFYMMTELDEIKLKVVILGEPGTGKTTLMNRYCKGTYCSFVETGIGSDCVKKKIEIDGTKVIVEVWDTLGQEIFQAVNQLLYRGTHCCVLAYDVRSMMSFKAISYWRDTLETRGYPVDGKTCPFVVVGNMIDVDVQKHEVSRDAAEEWCKAKKFPLFECSAKSNDNVNTAFATVIKLALQEQRRVSQYNVKQEKLRLERENAKTKSGWC